MLKCFPSPNSLRKAKLPTPIDQAKSHVLEGLTLMRHGNFANASIIFQKAITTDPNCEEAYIYQALALDPSATKEEKVVLYIGALLSNKDNLMAQYGMSCIKEVEGDFNSAYAIREEIVCHKAKTPSDYKAQALCTSDGTKYLSLLTTASKLDNEDPSIHYMIAQYWFSNKGYIKASAAVIKALKIDAEYVDALSLKGDILDKMNKYPESLSAYREALAINPRDVHSLTNMAEAFYKHQEYKKSIEFSQQIIQLNGAHHLAYSYIAISLCGLNDIPEALTSINQALELAPNDVLYHCLRAKIYMFLNNIDYAVKDLNEAFRLHNEQQDVPADEEESVENFVQTALEERAELIENLAKLSSPSLDTMYGAEEKREEAKKLQEERKALITEVIESLDSPRTENTNMKAKLAEKTELILELQCKISLLRKEKNAEILEKIESNEHLTRYLDGFALTWSQTFTASQSVTSGIVKINTDNLAVTAASTIVSFIPFFSNILSTITQITGDFIIKANILQHANNFVQIAPNHTRLDIIAESVGMKLAVHFEEKICNPALGKPQATNWWNKVIDAITTIGCAIEQKVFGELYPSYEAKLGHYHASKIISEISEGNVDLSHKNTLPELLFELLLGVESQNE